MQNIYITRYRETTIDLPSVANACFNQLEKTFYVADKQNGIHQLSYDATNQSVKLIEIIPADPELVGNTIINMTYLVDPQCLCVVTRQGAIFKVSTKETELVAQNQDGIEKASWSSAQDRLVIITKNNTLIQLNEEFNLQTQLPLNDEAEEGDATNAQITWKSDGKFCAINFGIKGSNARKCLIRDNLLNVFKSAAKADTDPKGLVQSVSQAPVSGLQHAISWNPTSNIIAGVDVIQGNKRIIFWQKNGLRHLQFPLQEWVECVKDLSYSPDGEILYVQVNTKQKSHQLLIYHRGNYHWYLKTSIKLQDSDRYIVFKERRNSLFIIGNGRFEAFQFTIKPNNWEWKSQKQQKVNSSCVFYSVDSNRLLISDYAKSIIPPPMCLKQIRTDTRILATSKLQNQILVITTQSIYIYDHSSFSLNLLCPNTIKQRLASVRLTSLTPPTFIIGSNEYLVNSNQLQIKQLENVEDFIFKPIITLNNLGQGQSIPIQIYQINNQLFVNDVLLSEEATSFCLYDVFLLFTTSTSELYQKLYVFNLEIDTQIYLETSPTLLKKLQGNSLNMRNVERGSKIIGCSQGRCIFQLPRGNLQGIYPKIITLLNVKRAIYKFEYLKAFELIRTHKLDINILFDLHPEQFLSQTQQILSDIRKVDYISLLIASLKQGVSDEVKYCFSKQEIQKIQDYFQINAKNKVKTVCDLISKGLRSLGYQQYILAIVAAQVKKGELAKVLHQIKTIKAQDVVVKLPPHLTEEPKQKKKLNSKQILQYVCWMADPQIVYKTAFLTYDLDLVAMAAEFTQKDPKQYLPYLEELKSIPDEVDRRSRISLDLKQYEEAVKQLSVGSPSQKNQAVQLVKEHNLFKTGIQSFRNEKKYLLEIKRLLGLHLQNKDQFKEALNIYLTCGLYEDALNLSLRLLDVRNSVDIMRFLKHSQENMKEKVNEMITRLVENPNDGQSLGFAYEYLSQYEDAAKIYIKTEDFSKLNKILKYLPEQYVSTQIVDSHKFVYSLKFNQTLSQIKNFTEKYLRLQSVQKLKKLTGTLVIATKQADQMYSEYSRVSGQSRSNYTVSTTTGMKKKKQKVKGILNRNVKQGSPLEQEYLVAVLNDLSAKALQTIKSNKILIQQLIYMNLLTEAESLRNQTRTYAQLITKRVRPYKETKYQEEHPDVIGIYPEYVPKAIDGISSFDYII